MSTQKAPEAVQRSEGDNPEPNHQGGIKTMTILAPDLRPVDCEPFDEILTVDARFAGGTITLEPEHVEWLGADIVKVDMPGHTLHLRPHEARDLASALQCLAQHVDEQQPREIHRHTEPGTPDLDGRGGGL